MPRTPQQAASEVKPIVLHWEQFTKLFAKSHKQGEHISAVGQTGSGKTVLMLEICKIVGSKTGKDGRPSRVTVLGTKPRDDTLMALKNEGWPIIKSWPPAYGEEHCIVWPKASNASAAAAKQRAVFLPLLDEIFIEGSQAVFIDEAGYFEEPQPKGLGLASTMNQFWTAARGNKLTLIAATQRPRHVSVSMWTEPSWVFIFPPDDLEDLKRISEASGKRWEVMAIAEKLGPFEFLCIRRQRHHQNELIVSRVEGK